MKNCARLLARTPERRYNRGRGTVKMQAYIREIALLGEENFAKLRAARVAVFGIGGVGAFAAEALVRAGVGALTFVDGDVVAESNLNRQLIALHSTLGMNKAAAMRARAFDIDPQCACEGIERFYDENTADSFDLSLFDYIADCIDSVKSKVLLIARARAAGVPVISCMGAGNKLDGGAFQVADIEKTRECPLAKIVRRELKKAGVTGVKAVFSEEKPRLPDRSGAAAGEKFIGSISFVPGAAGLLLAGEIVKDIAFGAAMRTAHCGDKK